MWQCGSDEDYPHCEVANETGSKRVPQDNPTMQFDIKSTKSHALLKMANFSAPYVSANAKIVELLFPYSIETRFWCPEDTKSIADTFLEQCGDIVTKQVRDKRERSFNSLFFFSSSEKETVKIFFFFSPVKHFIF